MTTAQIGALLWGIGAIVLILAVMTAKRGKRRGGTLTGAVAGTLWDLQTQDKRHALEIIVEDKAEARDPEDKDGNLPELEDPAAVKTRRE